ncbi:hypothetical protein OUZ56_017267 [Daphnia magna]|uniref:Uncharacterized protein n=1 Tax=Daphnia magna TaxID=35525 RepID=A0ABR0ASJ7_9CRUS|nr:hypothetical protein OUZ56_017267 [Daphnia magna]
MDTTGQCWLPVSFYIVVNGVGVAFLKVMLEIAYSNEEYYKDTKYIAIPYRESNSDLWRRNQSIYTNSISFRGLNAVRQNMTTTPVRVQVPGLNLQQEIGSSIRYTSATCLTHSVATPSRSGT